MGHSVRFRIAVDVDVVAEVGRTTLRLMIEAENKYFPGSVRVRMLRQRRSGIGFDAPDPPLLRLPVFQLWDGLSLLDVGIE